MLFLLALAACFLIPSEREMKHDYEWFHDAYNQIEAKASQIRAHHELVLATEDTKELSRLRLSVEPLVIQTVSE
jgi:hypothetical protein